jgi:hypothetical protein
VENAALEAARRKHLTFPRPAPDPDANDREGLSWTVTDEWVAVARGLAPRAPQQGTMFLAPLWRSTATSDAAFERQGVCSRDPGRVWGGAPCFWFSYFNLNVTGRQSGTGLDGATRGACGSNGLGAGGRGIYRRVIHAPQGDIRGTCLPHRDALPPVVPDLDRAQEEDARLPCRRG